MLETLLWWDTALFAVLNQAGSDWLDPIMAAISNRFIWIPLYLLLLFGLYRVLSLKHFLIALGFLVVLVFATDQSSVQLFKFQFEHPRPCHEPMLYPQARLVNDHCGGPYGFVSSHATNTFGLAVFAGLLFRHRQWILYALLFWAALNSYSRIYLGVHYPLDVLGGMLLGSGIGFLLAQLYFYWPGGQSQRRAQASSTVESSSSSSSARSAQASSDPEKSAEEKSTQSSSSSKQPSRI